VYEKKSDDFYEMFHFVYPGYNLRPIEMEAAVGREQLKKLSGFIEARRKNGESYLEIFKDSDKVIIQEPLGESSYFGFPFILKEAGKRKEVLTRLKDEGIEYRPIVSGNFTRNPVVDYYDYSVFGTLANADFLHENGFFVGNHHFDCGEKLRKILDLF
jgi:CDP-6-deoxy-D-xylo-4-hexulose-3-dehydrase